ncbi:hypothetical protein CSB37_04050 [bacterium DOLZORAL124_38_8]|nr:MAG: hypothetical protein CSB37_04050 [bacterium DOLZORAL124_38_8]
MTNENTSVTETTNPSAPEAVGAPEAAETKASSQPTGAENQPAEDFLQTTETLKKDMVSGEEKGLAALGYLPFTVLVPLVLKKDSAFCKEHAKQGIVIAALFGGMFLILPFLGMFKLWVLLYLGVAGFGAFTAFTGAPAKMPMVSEVANKIKL